MVVEFPFAMGSRHELNAARDLASLVFDLGYRGTADAASKIAGVCVAEELCVLEDFCGVGDLAQIPAFSSSLAEADINFLDSCMLPAAKSAADSVKRRRVAIAMEPIQTRKEAAEIEAIA